MKIDFKIMILMLTSCSCSIQCALITVTDETLFHKTITNNNNPILLIFSSESCDICKKIKAPIIKLSQEERCKNVTFATVIVDKVPHITKQYNIIGVPTFIYLKNGKIINKTVGIKSNESIENQIQKNLTALLDHQQKPSGNKQHHPQSKFAQIKEYLNDAAKTLKVSLHNAKEKIKTLFM